MPFALHAGTSAAVNLSDRNIQWGRAFSSTLTYLVLLMQRTLKQVKSWDCGFNTQDYCFVTVHVTMRQMLKV